MKRLTLIDKALLLKNTPLFGSLDLDLLLPIADKLVAIEYDAGETIFGEGEQGTKMFLIVEGSIELTSRSEKVLLKESNFFGDESLFNEQLRAYSAISKSDSLLLTLTKNNLFSIISESPTVAISFLQVYATTIPFREVR